MAGCKVRRAYYLWQFPSCLVYLLTALIISVYTLDVERLDMDYTLSHPPSCDGHLLARHSIYGSLPSTGELPCLVPLGEGSPFPHIISLSRWQMHWPP